MAQEIAPQPGEHFMAAGLNWPADRRGCKHLFMGGREA
jgi:hypothetical protein